MDFHVHAIPADVLDAVRRDAVDVSGNPVVYRAAKGGEPLRCCLRDAQPGERLILFGFEPPLPASPYREIGAVFAHAVRCAGPASVDSYPEQWRGRRQVLRGYDRRGWIHVARVHDGSDPDRAIADVLADADVERVHSRNVAHGCYMFAVTRAGTN
jgi:hypothetical protein